MKKIILLASVVTVASFASCKKDRTCECTYTNSGSTNVTHTSSTVLTKVKKSDAKYLCTKDTYMSTNTTSGGTSTTSTNVSDCKLK
ncbi:MAG: hypothetical protein V4565_06395 [Bacteroidota bacterium]